ncbi:hypothetical protein ASU31_13875 [Pedobacter ginsenosidimutans]|uniref:DUF2975 domain-containing protein n=1 Tax=Pedobacter ginsenosidimutans TaxID=687842 RepID=A0A0T5VP08_9SPHI|nr:DUF2975 domain-containing protein [Pedobacter ginsenosidimutans]KRT15439.1 hypothetical protein ASU31_13875 [Pedobacter ginsenosidimutans]
MKYKILARVIRAFLMLLICFVSFTCVMDLGSYLFNTKRYMSIPGGGAMGDMGGPGTYLPLSLSISIPDTSIWYKNGSFETRSKRVHPYYYKSDREVLNNSPVIRKVINTLVVLGKENEITVDNGLRMNGPVFLKFHSKNNIYNAFWFFYAQIRMYAIILLLILLIKLVNIYLTGDFLCKRSFKLISLIGILLISVEFFELICIFINVNIISAVRLETKELISGFSNQGGADLHFNFGGPVNFQNVGIGIIIIILSKVIKDAVLIKQENDLTI